METTASHFPGYFTTDSRNSYNDGLTELAAKGAMDNCYRTAKSEADIKASILTGVHLLEKSIGDGFCDTAKSIGEVKCEISKSECEILKNAGDIAHRNTIALSSLERNLQKEIALEGDKTRTQLYAFERAAAEEFCKIKTEGLLNTQKILERLSADTLDRKNDRINELMHDKTHSAYTHQFALQNAHLDYLKQSINSIEQNQRFSSKTVQFGAGNVAIPTQTANQG